MKVKDLLWAMWGCDPEAEVIVQFVVHEERRPYCDAFYRAPAFDAMRAFGDGKQLVVSAAATAGELAQQFPDPGCVRDVADNFVREVESALLEDDWDEDDEDDGPGRDVPPLAGDGDDGFPF